MSNRDHQITMKILSEINVLEELVKELNLESFLDDEKTKWACCMTLINIGELVKNLTDEFKENFDFVPWKSIAGMRDVAAHKYQTLKMGDVWITIEKDIPKLKVELNRIYPD